MGADVARRLCMLALGGSFALWAGAGPLPSPADDRSATTPGLLMILSPRMVYSLREWPRMRRAAEREGFVVQTVRDPRVGDREWRAAAWAAGRPEAIGLPVLDAAMPASAKPGVLNHSPMSLVRLGSRVHPWPIAGVMPDAAWISVLRHRLDQLRSAR